VNAYVLDPSHIAPSRSDSNSNGHFPMTGSNQSGTPRNFNLMGNYNMQQFHMNPAAAAAAAAAMSQAHGGAGLPAMQMAALLSQMSNGGAPMGHENGGGRNFGGPGPVRRQGNRFNRANGPYDRPGNNNKDGRNARWNVGNDANGGGGRLTPPKLSSANHDAQEDAEAGADGDDRRNLRSYEDLDAAGANVGDLDY
jgi:hypothetical protein